MIDHLKKSMRTDLIKGRAFISLEALEKITRSKNLMTTYHKHRKIMKLTEGVEYCRIRKSKEITTYVSSEVALAVLLRKSRYKGNVIEALFELVRSQTLSESSLMETVRPLKDEIQSHKVTIKNLTEQRDSLQSQIEKNRTQTEQNQEMFDMAEENERIAKEAREAQKAVEERLMKLQAKFSDTIVEGSVKVQVVI